MTDTPDEVAVTMSVELPGNGRADVATYHQTHDDNGRTDHQIAVGAVDHVARAMRVLLGEQPS